jgi:predicted N-acetyltransferase YhbS
MLYRVLQRDEITLLWTIDRSEEIFYSYYVEQGQLKKREDYFKATGWPDGEADLYTPILYDCFDRGGLFFGCFEGGHLIGLSVLDMVWLGPKKDLLQLDMLHVDCKYRGQGIGSELFRKAKIAAAEYGALGLYISATPTENTIHFYLKRGATLIDMPDPELFAREPYDIHLVCPV